MKKQITLYLIIGLAIGAYLFTDFQFNKKEASRVKWEQYLADQFKKAENQKESKKMDNPEMAALQNYYMTIDPELKRVPNEKLINAYNFTKSLKKQQNNKGSSEKLEWTVVPSNMGGRTRAIMWDPNDTEGKKVWAGGVTGGLWYNTDIYNDDNEWQPVDDYWPNLTVSTIIYDPNEPATFYVGTGEYQTAREIYRESSGCGIGIWKSIDAGETWELIPSTSDFKYISDLKIRNENNVSVLYAGVVSGTYHGINHQSEPNDGLYRSLDGGEVWEQVLPDISSEDVPYSPADLDIGPSGRIFVGTMKNLEGHGGSAILFSDEGTSGSWTVYDDYESIIQNDPDYYVPGRVIVATAASDENRVYALLGAGYYNSSGFNYSRGRYIIKSDDGGVNWSETNLPGGDPEWATLSWHAFTAAVSPVNPDEIYVGGLDEWKSSNAGNSWSHISDWALMYYGGGDDYVHADQHLQLYKDGSSEEMLFGSDGGVFYTDNSSSGNPAFQEKNRNYGTLQFYSIDIYPVPGLNYMVGGLQDNGTLLYMGEPLDINDMIDGGDGAYCFFDENQPQIMISSVYYNSYTIYMNWNYYNDMGDYGTGVFINPADYDSENNILYANGVTFNGNNSNRILRITGIPDSPNDQLVSLNTGISVYFSHVKVSPHSPSGASTLFLGSQNGKLFKVFNAHSTPSTVEIGSDEFPVAYLSSVAIGGSEDTLLATFSNYGVQSVWQTYDGGDNWEDISGNLPDMPIRWAIYHPQNSKQVMLATEIGVWSTNDAGSGNVSWEPDPGMPNVRVDMLQMRTLDNTVAAATHGRGMMYTTWDYNPTILIGEKDYLKMDVYPNPASDYIKLKIAENSVTDLSINSQDGKLVYQKKVNGNERIDVAGLAKGVYIITCKTECSDRVYKSKIIIQR